ncbi:hypothetical protein [Corynebacterium glutamicum]|nr:hypothetical protein [Corynebacterium glutamicum]KIH74432.1 hypothetical protein SD36_03635 [Corynebacterium glutamicum]
MQTTTGETSISNETSFNASRETSLTALGFLDYLDEEQRAALLGEGALPVLECIDLMDQLP